MAKIKSGIISYISWCLGSMYASFDRPVGSSTHRLQNSKGLRVKRVLSSEIAKSVMD